MSRHRGSVLYVYPRYNDARDPSAGGAENRTCHLLRETRKSYSVSLLQAGRPSTSNPAVEPKTTFFDPLTPMFLTDLNPSYFVALATLLRDNDYDVVQVECLGGVLTALFLGRLLSPDIAVVYGSHNVEADRIGSVRDPGLPLYKRLGGPVVIPLLERLAVRHADHVIAVSDSDRDRFCERFSVPRSNVSVVPSGTDPVDPDRLDSRAAIRSKYDIPEDEVCLVFHGTFENHANREAVNHIRQRILPKLSGTGTDVSVYVAGKGMSEVDDGRVVPVGFVPDLSSFLNAMDVAVVPITSGGGTKLKLFDYMSVGLPIVATRKAMEGIDVLDGEEAVVLDDVGPKFAAAVESLVNDPDRRQRLGRRSKQLADSKYSWESVGETLRSVYADLCLDRRERRGGGRGPRRTKP